MTERILELISRREFAKIREMLHNMNVVDIAELLDELSKEDTVRTFRLMPKETAAETFSYMSKEAQQNIIEAITDKELSGIMEELFLDDSVDLIEEMPANVVKKVLANTDVEKRKLINQFLQYHEDSAGSLMTNEFVDLHKEMTVLDAFAYIRRTGVDKETIYTCYVMDKNRKLEGIVSVKTLLLSDEDSIIGDIMDTNVIFAYTDDDKEEIANTFRKYDFLSIPVVDKEKRLVGIITIDDAVEVLEQENTEDFEKMAAIVPSDNPYLKTNVFVHAKKRIGWLLFLMISATFTGAILSSYEEAFKILPILVSFIPMLMDTGGNSGAQASTLIIRGMALKEIEQKDFLKVLWKEIRISVLIGAVLAIFNIIRIWIIDKSLSLAITIGLSLYATVVISKTVGCILPFVAKKVKLDPAIMASPLITTIVDAGALVTYFQIAKIILGI